MAQHHAPTVSAGSSNVWMAATLGLAGLIVGYVVGSSYGSPLFAGVPTPPPAAPADAVLDNADEPPVAGKGPTLGTSSAPLTLIEFTDFQCPFCERHFTQTFPQIKSEYIDTGKLKYELRSFPLSFHGNAHKASEAALCANDQDKFWQMHEKIFGGQGAWSDLPPADAAKTFKQYAAEIGLSAQSFAACLDGGTNAGIVDADTADGAASGINGTPGFWLIGPDGKGKQISGALPYASFQSEFDAML